MRTLLLILFLVCGNFLVNQPACAYTNQPSPKGNISKEEFRQQQKEYIISKAQLTPKEASYFFPLFFELQDKKKVVNDDAASKMKKAINQELNERQYESVINQLLNAQAQIEKLEREYVNKYRKFLSNKKIFKVMTAEDNFRRDMLKNVRK